MVLFCMFKQKTAYELRSSGWSSDVCSSGLRERLAFIVDTRLSLRRLRFTDEVAIAENREGVDAEQTAQADLASMMGTLRQHLTDLPAVTAARSDERRVGKAGVSTCRLRWYPDIHKSHTPKQP